MKTMFRNFGYCCLAAFSVGTTYAQAQHGHGFTTGATGQAGTSLRLFQGEARALPMPGRIWVESNIGDGLGYQGTYFTLGGKTHLADDFLDGRWLLETQGHISENGGFFGNLGLERVFTLQAAGADLSLSGWIDYDGDEVGDFAHSYWQAAANASVRTAKWDLIGNAYFPLGTSVYTQGELGRVSFYQHNIALQAGLDTALQGYDVTFRAKPLQFANMNGNLDMGVYGYESDAVRYFTGVRARAGMQMRNGWRLSGEVNRDDLFGWTGVAQVAYTWGVNDRGIYAGLGNDLDPTVRNDHIVRFQQKLIVAINPDTGAPYHVYHVDNQADGTGIGTFESRFHTLAAAEAASGPNDVIFVYRGDGTTSGYDMGITLQDNQYFLGEGVQHLMPLAGGTSFILPNLVDGNRPIITNVNGPAILIDGSDTVIRGFEIDGAGDDVFMSFGIQANGIVNPIRNFRIEDVDVRNALLDGIRLENASGDATMVRVNVEQSGRDGINLTNFGDAETNIVLRDVEVNANNRDGVHFNTYDAATIQFQEDFTAIGNLRYGVNLINFVNSSGEGGAFTFIAPNIIGNSEGGMRIVNADGNFLFQDSFIFGNGGHGLALIGVKNTNPLHSTLITSTGANASIFSFNSGSGIFNNLNEANTTQRLLVEFSLMNGNNTGFTSQASGIGAFLTTDVLNNFGIANNLIDGVVLRSINGALHNATVTNTLGGLGRLNMNGNGAAGSGNGFTLLAGDALSPDLSTLNATIRNVSLINIGAAGTDSGVFGGTGNLGLLTLDADDLIIENAGQGLAFRFEATDPDQISRIRVINSDVTFSRSIGMLLENLGGSSVDVLVDNVFFQNDNEVQLGSAGVLVSNTGTMRLAFRNNLIDNFDSFGLVVQTGGAAGRTLADIEANVVTDNGPLNIINGIAEPPHEDGVRFLTTGDAQAHIRFNDNIVTGNAQQGLNLTTAGNSELTVLMTNNSISANDQGGLFPPDVPQDAFIRDMISINGVNARTNLAMSFNTFVFPADIFNFSGAASYILELDGLTNGVGFPTVLLGGVTPTPYGTVVEPAIEAEEAAFTALGF